MRRTAAVVMSLMCVMVACGDADTPGDERASSSETAVAIAASHDIPRRADAIRVGAWYPLTGSIATNGVPQSQGAAAYFASVNDSGGVNGRPIEFLFEDNAFDPQRTITIARKLVEQDDVDLIACPNGTPHTEATFSFVLDQAEVPIFGAYGGLASWYEPPRPNLYGLQTPPLPDQAEFLANWLTEDGHARVSIVVDEIALYVDQAAALEELLSAKGVEIDVVAVATGTTDWNPAVGEVVSFGPDATAVLTSIAEAVGYLQEAQRQELVSDVYVPPASANQSLLDLAGDAGVGVKASGYNPPVNATEASAAMQALVAVRDEYAPDADLTPDFIWSFACAQTLVEILGRVDGELTPASFADAAYTIENFDAGGLYGPVTFSPQRHAGQRALVRLQESDGQWSQISDFISTDPTVLDERG